MCSSDGHSPSRSLKLGPFSFLKHLFGNSRNLKKMLEMENRYLIFFEPFENKLLTRCPSSP